MGGHRLSGASRAATVMQTASRREAARDQQRRFGLEAMANMFFLGLLVAR